MTLNPIVQEAVSLHFRTPQFRKLHLWYIAILAVVTVTLWPSRGFMEYFRLRSVPAAFEAIAVLQLLGLTGISVFVGLDRLAGIEILRYSEWLEHTRVSIGRLATGKLVSALVHTAFLVIVGSPFLFICAGPAGIPVRAILSTQWIIFLVALFSRIVGMLISVIGESRDVVRIIGSWIYLALLYLGTIQLFQPLNPIIAVVRQQNETSPLVSTVGPVPLAQHPALPSSIYLVSGLVLVTAGFVLALHRHRSRARDVRRAAHD